MFFATKYQADPLTATIQTHHHNAFPFVQQTHLIQFAFIRCLFSTKTPLSGNTKIFAAEQETQIWNTCK